MAFGHLKKVTVVINLRVNKALQPTQKPRG